MKIPLTFTFLAHLAILAVNDTSAQAASDSRFGTVGPSNGNWSWYRLYNQDYAGINSSTPPDFNRLYTVGKLDDPGRSMSGGDWCTGGIDFLKCDRSSQSRTAQKEVYDRIFEYDKTGIRTLITEFNRRYGSGASANNYSGTKQLHITVGNEPNWHPYVHPEVYAAVFKEYYDFIKGPAPSGLNCASCVVHNGGVILANFNMEPAPETFIEAGLVWLDLVGSAAANQSNHRLDYMTWTRIYLQELLAGLNGRYDIFDVHLYDIDLNWNGIGVAESGLASFPKFLQVLKGGSYAWGANGTIASNNLHCATNCTNGAYYSLVNDLGRCIEFQTGLPMTFKAKASCDDAASKLQAGGHVPTSFPYWVPNPVVWVDEFGLVKDGGSQTYAQTVMQNYVSYFKTQGNIQRWFWYKNVGKDDAIFGNKILRAWSSMDWESDQIALFQNSSTWTRNPLGDKYFSLQDPAFANYNYPRFSFDPPNLATHLGLQRWSVDPKNVLLSWDFGAPGTAGAWGVSGSQQYADGMNVNSSPCPALYLHKNLTSLEIAQVDGAGYMVVENGIHTPSDGVEFILTFRNKANTAITSTTEISDFAEFSPTRNILADQGMPNVVDIQAYKPAGYELSAVEYREGVSGTACRPGDVYPHQFGRVYFATNNPVPVIGLSNHYLYAGVILEKEISALQQNSIPINLNTAYCTNCSLTLDANSTAKGITIQDQNLKWNPTSSQIGFHTGTITINIGGTNISKSFSILVDKPKVSFITAMLSLLLLN